jgi:hypothetical protein
MEFTDSGSQSMDSPPREMKMMDAVAVASGDIRASMTTMPLSPPSPDRQHCSSTTESRRLVTHVSSEALSLILINYRSIAILLASVSKYFCPLTPFLDLVTPLPQ